MPTDLALLKTQIRKRLLTQRAALDSYIAHDAARAAQGRLLALEIWRAATTVALYMAFRSEMATDLLLEDAWAAGKRVLLPRCRPCDANNGAGDMDLAAVSCMEEIRPGAYGIREPDPEVCLTAGALAPDLAVIPAVAFDRQGFRLGYGGGYYDRYLARPGTHCTRCVGLGFAFQVLNVLPREPWDKPVHFICTEEELIWA